MQNLASHLSALSEKQTAALRHKLGLTGRASLNEAARHQSQQLIAYVVPREDYIVDPEELRQYAQERLPNYMLPASFVWLDELPYTANGKIDRRALLELDVAPEEDIFAGEIVAPQTETERKLFDIWSELLGTDYIGIHDGFFEVGGDSILGIQVIARARKQGLAISPRQLFTEQTIARLAQAIDQDAADDAPDPVLLPLNTSGSRRPFFYAHGIFGDVSSITNIAPLLDEDQPLYGLQAVGLQPGSEPDRTVEQMAARYIKTIQTVQPAGPYHLGGFCFGGVVAYEMARQLKEAGEETTLLIIIEGSAPIDYHAPKPFYDHQRLQIIGQNFPFFSSGYREFGSKVLNQKMLTRLGKHSAAGSDELTRDGQDLEYDMEADFNASRPEIQKQVKAVNWQAGLDYRPKPYTGEVTLYRAGYLHTGHALFGNIDPLRGWGGLTNGNVDLHFIEGTHSGILTLPYAAALARVINQALESAAR